MPFIQVTCIEGPTPEQRRRLIDHLTEVVVTELRVPAEAVNVVLTTVHASDWGHAGRPLGEVLSVPTSEST